MEGYWVGGKWCPGPLYYYVNFHKIQLDSDYGVAQMPAYPYFRDNEWELFFIYEEARGFSGFEGDTKTTCNRFYGPEREMALQFDWITQEEADSKEYIPAREYLRRIHTQSLGRPLYENSAKNILSLQGRGTGKSYSASGMIAHNFLFDGATDYDRYLYDVKHKSGDDLPSSQTILGAVDTKYSEPLAAKVKFAFEKLPGGMERYDIPSPFWRTTHGSLSNNKIYYCDKSNSQIWHRVFQDNALAANGSRPNLAILDEVGFLSTIKTVLPGLETTMGQRAKRKNLVIFGLGTGGLFEGSAALYAQDIAHNPEDYDCLAFDDPYEDREDKICHFVPGHFALNDFKEGPNRITNIPKAEAYMDMEIEKARKTRRPEKYLGKIINHPKKLSDIFLSEHNNNFPTAELQERLGQVLSSKKIQNASWRGDMVFTGTKTVLKVSDVAYPIVDFPLPRNVDRKGCVELFAKPTEEFGSIHRYVIGADTVDKADSTTDSLFSVLVFDRITRNVVAEWTGRRRTPKEQYEIVRRLSIYYNNAPVMYEQHLTGIFQHFERHHCTSLLMDTPHSLRNNDTFRLGTNTSKGMNTPAHVVDTGNELIIDWLLEDYDKAEHQRLEIIENGGTQDELSESQKLILPLYRVRSIGLLRELIMYNRKEGNFDRVAALRMALWADKTLTEIKVDKVKQVKTISEDPYFMKHFGVSDAMQEMKIPHHGQS